MLGTVSREAGCEYVEHGLLAFLLGLLDNALSALSQGSKNIVYVALDTAANRSKISASGLVVKSNVAIVGPRVRFTAGAFFFFCFDIRGVALVLDSLLGGMGRLQCG